MSLKKNVYLVASLFLVIVGVQTAETAGMTDDAAVLTDDIAIQADNAAAQAGTYTFLPLYRDTVLQADHYGTIEVMANNITLNLNGYAVIGNGQGSGIKLNNKNLIIIENGYIQNHYNGIEMYKGADPYITDVDISGCYRGLYVYGTSSTKAWHCHIENAYIFDNTYGIKTNYADHCCFFNVYVYYNNSTGIDASNTNASYHCPAYCQLNNGYGLKASNWTYANVMSNGTDYQSYFTNNSLTGVYLLNSSKNNYFGGFSGGGFIDDNTNYGLYLSSGCGSNTFENYSGQRNGIRNKYDGAPGSNSFINCYFP